MSRRSHVLYDGGARAMNARRQTLRDVTRDNAEFWNTLAGSQLAESLGISDCSAESLARFDREYFEYYPYLLGYVGLGGMAGKKVAEIGLGYGSLGQRIVEAGADYVGLDVAQEPVRLLNRRLHGLGLPGRAIQGNMLDCPLPSAAYDQVVSIGCYHHTGDVQRCIDQTFRILKPGGMAVVMVYNLFSYRQWHRWPRKTLRAWVNSVMGRDSMVRGDEEQRFAYDRAGASEKAAPETVFLSARQLRVMFGQFSDVTIHKENCNSFCHSLSWEFPAQRGEGASGRLAFRIDLLLNRKTLLRSLGRRCGLDLYVTARK
jgi:SAM-dependent methyltransferase